MIYAFLGRLKYKNLLTGGKFDRILELIVAWAGLARNRSCWNDFKHGKLYRVREVSYFSTISD